MATIARMVKSQRRGRLLAVEKMELGDIWSDQNIFDLIVMQIGHPLCLLVARATCKSLLLNSHKVRARMYTHGIEPDDHRFGVIYAHGATLPPHNSTM